MHYEGWAMFEYSEDEGRVENFKEWLYKRVNITLRRLGNIGTLKTFFFFLNARQKAKDVHESDVSIFVPQCHSSSINTQKCHYRSSVLCQLLNVEAIHLTVGLITQDRSITQQKQNSQYNTLINR